MAESRSSRALDALLDEGGKAAESVKATVERTTLWRWRTGKSTPLASDASELDRLTDGKVPADGWSALEDEPAPSSERVPNGDNREAG